MCGVSVGREGIDVVLERQKKSERFVIQLEACGEYGITRHYDRGYKIKIKGVLLSPMGRGERLLPYSSLSGQAVLNRSSLEI